MEFNNNASHTISDDVTGSFLVDAACRASNYYAVMDEVFNLKGSDEGSSKSAAERKPSYAAAGEVKIMEPRVASAQTCGLFKQSRRGTR